MARGRLYLDVDGVLLGRRPSGGPDVVLAQGATELLSYALAQYDVYWLTTHCDGDPRPVLQYLRPYADADFLQLAAQVEPTAWRTLKVEALVGRDFWWLDDAPLYAERQWLQQRGLEERWIEVDTRRRPDDLARALERLHLG